tara:strand:- start:220 stop:1185 length:966 start_codon:yes stop_codon:yes gene_type:complete
MATLAMGHALKWLTPAMAHAMYSVALISCLPIALLLLLPKSPNSTILSLMTAFASGSLLGDTFLHSLPHQIADGQEYIGEGFLGGFIVFLFIDCLLRSLGGSHDHSHNENDDDDDSDYDGEDESVADIDYPGMTVPQLKVVVASLGISVKSGSRKSVLLQAIEDHLAGEEDIEDAVDDVFLATEGIFNAKNSGKGLTSVAMLSLIGDALHNFTDGLALGLSAVKVGAVGGELRLSVSSTTLAILIHEIPHELGDYAVLLTNGVSKVSEWSGVEWKTTMSLGVLISSFFLPARRSLAPLSFSSSRRWRRSLAPSLASALGTS